MFSYSTRMKFDSYSLKAAPSKHPPSKHPPSKHPPSKHPVSHALMSYLFDPNPDQVALGGLHPGVSSVSSVEKTVAYSRSPGQGAALASAPLVSSAGSP
jgi:hypothetical protein